MKHYYLIIAALIFVSQVATAQSRRKADGVTWKELRQTHFPDDSTASAAILSDVGKTTLSYFDGKGFEARHTRTVRIKIYATAGKQWGDVTVPYYDGGYRQEIVKDIKGVTYNEEDNRIVRSTLSQDAIYQSETSEHGRIKKFVLPNVRAGSVIEYSYTLVSPYIFLLPEWRFQHEIPVVYSELSARIPAFYEYSIIYHGYAKLTTSDVKVSRTKEHLGDYTYNDVNYLWVAEHLPAFNDESFISSRDDYLARLTFQLKKENFPGRSTRDYMKTWSQLSKDFFSLTDYGKYMKKKDGSEQAEALSASATTGLEIAQAIDRYVKKRLAWNEVISLTPEHSPKQTLAEGSGNSADINIVLRNMLAAAGLPAKPVLLSTRSHGHVSTKYPVIDQFNYSAVHVVVDGQEYVLDATDPDLPFGVLPLHCINGYGLIVDEQADRWVSLESGKKYVTETFVLASHNPEHNEFVADVSRKEKGYAALLARKQYRSNKQSITGFAANNFKIKNLEEVNKSLLTSFTTSYPITPGGDRLYINPFYYSALNETPFKAVHRQHPIDYSYLRTYKHTFVLTVPEGYTLEEAPTPVEYSLEDKSVQFVFQVKPTSLGVQLLSIVQVNRPMVDASYYPALKELYETVVAKHSESIVLRKK